MPSSLYSTDGRDTSCVGIATTETSPSSDAESLWSPHWRFGFSESTLLLTIGSATTESSPRDGEEVAAGVVNGSDSCEVDATRVESQVSVTTAPEATVGSGLGAPPKVGTSPRLEVPEATAPAPAE